MNHNEAKYIADHQRDGDVNSEKPVVCKECGISWGIPKDGSNEWLCRGCQVETTGKHEG